MTIHEPVFCYNLGAATACNGPAPRPHLTGGEAWPVYPLRSGVRSAAKTSRSINSLLIGRPPTDTVRTAGPVSVSMTERGVRRTPNITVIDVGPIAPPTSPRSQNRSGPIGSGIKTQSENTRRTITARTRTDFLPKCAVSIGQTAICTWRETVGGAQLIPNGCGNCAGCTTNARRQSPVLAQGSGASSTPKNTRRSMLATRRCVVGPLQTPPSPAPRFGHVMAVSATSARNRAIRATGTLTTLCRCPWVASTAAGMSRCLTQLATFAAAIGGLRSFASWGKAV